MNAGVAVAASNSYAECSKCAIAYAPWQDTGWIDYDWILGVQNMAESTEIPFRLSTSSNHEPLDQYVI